MTQWMQDLGRTRDSVSVLLAGPTGRVTTWYQALMADSRFRVGSFATDPEDLQRKLANSPEVVLIDATIFPGPPPLIDLLTSVPGAAYVVLPADVPDAILGQVRSVPSVKGAFRGDVNLAELAGRMHDTAMTLRTRAPALEGPWRADRQPGRGVTGLRIVAVWNEAGGVGKTTVATCLAYEAASRGMQTLLIGLGAPDDMPLILGLEPEPNLSGWHLSPTAEGLKSLIQRVGDLDVIAGFRNVVEEARALGIQPEDPGSIPGLAMTAAYIGYAVVVLDAPPSTSAPAAILAANTLLLVSRPTAAGAQRTVEAYRTVVQRLAGEHRIAPANIYIVLNLAGSGDYAPDEWHQMVASSLKKAGLGAPPVVATLPEDPAVKAAQNNGRVPSLVSRGLAQGMDALGGVLFGTGVEARQPEGRGIRIGGLRLRIRR